MKDHLDNVKAQTGTALGMAGALRGTSIQETIDLQTKNSCGQVSLREQIASRLVRAQQESFRAIRLQRFVDLADRNPEVLEMLELVRDLNLL